MSFPGDTRSKTGSVTRYAGVMANGQEPSGRLRGFLFPAGEERARAVRAIRVTERGEMRMTPEAKWLACRAPNGPAWPESDR